MSSPTDRTRLFPKLSISSISPFPSLIFTKVFKTEDISSLVRTLTVSEISKSNLRLSLILPTSERSYLSFSKNRVLNNAPELSTVGGSPGRKIL